MICHPILRQTPHGVWALLNEIADGLGTVLATTVTTYSLVLIHSPYNSKPIRHHNAHNSSPYPTRPSPFVNVRLDLVG